MAPPGAAWDTMVRRTSKAGTRVRQSLVVWPQWAGGPWDGGHKLGTGMKVVEPVVQRPSLYHTPIK